jgi:hypothetical protein
VSRVSSERASFLARSILEALRKKGLAEARNETYALREARRAIEEYFAREAEIDEAVRRKILSLARRVPPGSREWEVLYRKYREEERKKQNL